MVTRNRLGSVMLACTMAAFSGKALAQAASEAKPKAKKYSRVMEEVIVTAQKREENASDVPISIQAFSPEKLAAFGVENTTDLMKVTPGLDMGTQAGDFTSVFMRGIGSEAWLTSDPSVATYVDGIYYPFSPSVAQNLKGVERVEILKGPQGTLFGRNAVGGAINVVLKKPDFEDTWTEISLFHSEAKDRDINEASMFVNVPLADKVAMNFAMMFVHDEKVYTDDSTIGGKPVPADKLFSARAMMRWQINDYLDTRLTLQGAKRDGTSTLAANIDPTPLGRANGIDGEDGRNYKANPDLPIFGHLQTFVVSSQTEWALKYFDLKFLASQQAHSNPYNYDYDGTETPGASFVVHRHEADITEAELQIFSNEGTPWSSWLTLTAGAFLFKNEQGFDPVEVTVFGVNPAALEAAGIDPGVAYPDIFVPGSATRSGNDVVLGLTNVDLTKPLYALSNIGLVETDSWSAFLQATANVTDWMSITVGGRYQNEFRGVVQSETTLRGPDGEEQDAFIWTEARDENDNPYPLQDTTKGFKPKVAIDVTPFSEFDLPFVDPDTLLYASYQEAVKAHSYNAFAFYLPPAFVEAEETTAYEVGMKTTLFDGTTSLNMAFFMYEIQNLQTQSISLTNGGALSLDTAGTAESEGFDFDLIADVFPSIFGNLTFTLNAAYLDAVYTDYKDGAGHDPETGVFTQDNDFTGNRVTRTPEWSGSAGISNTWMIPGGPLETTVSYYYNSGFFYAATNDPRFSQPQYETFGAHASYLWEEANLRVTLSGQNLKDKFYTAGELKLDFGALASLAPRRTFGLRLDYEF